MELPINQEAKSDSLQKNIFQWRHPKLKNIFYKTSKNWCGRDSYADVSYLGRLVLKSLLRPILFALSVYFPLCLHISFTFWVSVASEDV